MRCLQRTLESALVVVFDLLDSDAEDVVLCDPELEEGRKAATEDFDLRPTLIETCW